VITNPEPCTCTPPRAGGKHSFACQQHVTPLTANEIRSLRDILTEKHLTEPANAIQEHMRLIGRSAGAAGQEVLAWAFGEEAGLLGSPAEVLSEHQWDELAECRSGEIETPTGDLIARAKAVLEGVAEGPWRVETESSLGRTLFYLPYIVGERGDNIGCGEDEALAKFIAASRTLVPALADDLATSRGSLSEAHHRADRLESKLAAARDIIRRLQRDNRMLTRQLDALHDTDLGEALTRNDELRCEVLDLRAQLASIEHRGVKS
jgi:hypothetical protein